ncbi:MAG TPA: hypothetical protein VGB57_03675 [Allosphingosinicella sp.]|jgi:hypothetical protein
MLSILAALLASSEPAQPARPQLPGRPAWVVATVAQSEWCPEGDVRLDLRTGEYALTPRAPRRKCEDVRLERPVKTGILDPKRLVALRAVASRAASEGLESQACRNGERPDKVVVSNGGPQILVLATGATTASAPDDLSCWTEAAEALYHLLDQSFAADSGRSR